MALHTHLLQTAREWLGQALVGSESEELDVARLRRATSNAYYALFHALSLHAADLLAGPGSREWSRVYRSLDHKTCKQACKVMTSGKAISPVLRECADHFLALQEARHLADYDPLSKFDTLDVIAHIQASEKAITGLNVVSEDDRRAFLLSLLFRERPG